MRQQNSATNRPGSPAADAPDNYNRTIGGGSTTSEYYQDAPGRWHRSNGQFASNAEVGILSPNNGSSGRGGRLGNDNIRKQNAMIADYLESQGYTITGGGGKTFEEYLPNPDGGRRGSNYVDITAVKGNTTIRINTVDGYADGETPTIREQTAADSINSKTCGSIIMIPKNTGLWKLPSIIENFNK